MAGKKITTHEEYIETFPEHVRELLENVRQTIRETAPGAKEIVFYQVPGFSISGERVLFAAFKNHIGLYPTPAVIEAFEQELSAYETAKGTVKFPLNKPIPYDLVRNIVHFIAGEHEASGQ